MNKMKLYVGSVVLTRFNGQPAANAFLKQLNNLGVKCYKHYTIPGYPSDIPFIVSDDGLGKNEFIETAVRLGVEFAVRKSAGTPFAKLYVAVDVQRTRINKGVDFLRALLHARAALNDDGRCFHFE